MVEICVAAGVLVIMLPIVAQLAFSSLKQRMRAQSEQAALELAQNVLDSARACPWEDLTPQWASAQTIPAQTAPLLPDGKLTVTIAAEKYEVRRVTVVIAWQTEVSSPRQLQLVTLLGPRRR